MPSIRTFSSFIGMAAVLALSVPAEAKISANKISANKISANKISANKLSANKLGRDGAFSDLSVIEFPNGVRITH